MTKASEIVARSLRKIGVAAQGEAITAHDSADAIEALNAMMHGWKLAGVDLEHTDLALTDDFPLGAEFEEGTVYNLAARLSVDYELPAAFDADDWFRKFQAAYATAQLLTVDGALLNMPSQRNYYEI